MKNRYVASIFICPDCKTQIPLPRSLAHQREKGHIKDLYCPTCKEVKKFKEFRYKEHHRSLAGEEFIEELCETERDFYCDSQEEIMISMEGDDRMEAYEQCNVCKEKSKKVIGFYDNENYHGCLFDCENPDCEIKQQKLDTEKKEKELKEEVARTNHENQVSADDLATARVSKMLSTKEVADGTGISVVELNAYEQERKAISTEIYQRIMDYIKNS